VGVYARKHVPTALSFCTIPPNSQTCSLFCVLSQRETYRNLPPQIIGPPADCAGVVTYILDRMSKHPNFMLSIDPKECWSAQTGSCRSFFCNMNERFAMSLSPSLGVHANRDVLNPNCGISSWQAGHGWYPSTNLNIFLAVM
jgi:hypothetical protein